MANGKTHAAYGQLVGGLTAACYARKQTPGQQLLETVGGIAGGWMGAKLPDVIDPPTSARHRSIGHGVAPCATMVAKYAHVLPALQASLRVYAQHHQQLAETNDGLVRLWHTILAMLCTLGAGALAGVLGGYVSHLALDAGTPMGLPVIA